jgi:F0F1-type ATP synthase membrane subunit b/b'
MRILLLLSSLLMLGVACSTPKESFQEQKEEVQAEYNEEIKEAEEEYNEEMKDAREELDEEQKEEAVDYVQDSEKAKVKVTE